MIYLKQLELASDNAETNAILSEKRTCFGPMYPFKIFPMKQLEYLDFSPITIIYGGNGSGKTTLLNIIAEKIGAIRHSQYNKTPFFERYVKGTYNNVVIDTNFVLTYYGRNGFDAFIDKNIKNNTFLYINKERSRNLSNSAKVQFFGKLKVYDFDTIIRQTRASVKKQLKKDSQYMEAVNNDMQNALGEFSEAVKAIKKKGSWSGKEILAIFEKYPSFDLVGNMYTELGEFNEDVMVDLVQTLSEIEDLEMLDWLSWYPVQARNAEWRKEYRIAINKYRKAINARVSEIAQKKTGATSLNIKSKQYSVSEIEKLFYKLNSNDDVKLLADKVFALAKTMRFVWMGSQRKKKKSLPNSYWQLSQKPQMRKK